MTEVCFPGMGWPRHKEGFGPGWEDLVEPQSIAGWLCKRLPEAFTWRKIGRQNRREGSPQL